MSTAVGLHPIELRTLSEGEGEVRETAGTQVQWYAAYTRSRHEKVVAETLEKRTVEHFLPLIGHRDVVVVSPDVGGVKRAEEFRQHDADRREHRNQCLQVAVHARDVEGDRAGRCQYSSSRAVVRVMPT